MPVPRERGDQPLLNLTWDYDFDEHPRLPDGTLSKIQGEPDVEKVPHGGQRLQAERDRPAHRPPAPGERFFRAEGRRHDSRGLLDLCVGVFPEPDRNWRASRKLGDNPLQPTWGYAWPQTA